MFTDWLRKRGDVRRSRRERRRLEQEARDAEVRAKVFAIMRTVAEPLVADGVATLDWLEPSPETGACEGARLTPAIHTDPDGPHPDWEDQLRQMLVGLTEGGLTELIVARRHDYDGTFRATDRR